MKKKYTLTIREKGTLKDEKSYKMTYLKTPIKV